MSRRWSIFAVTCSLFFLSQFYRATNAVIAPQLMQDLSLSTEQLGSMSAAFFYAFAVMQIPISISLDRLGARRLMTLLTLVGVAGAFIFASAHSLAAGILGRALLGAGMACNLMGTFKLLTVWFGPRSFATLSGLVFGIGTIGNMTATTPLVILVDFMGWRLTYCLIAIVTLLIALALYVVVRDQPDHGSAPPSKSFSFDGLRQGLADLGRLLRIRDYWIIALGTFARYGVVASFQTLWAGPYLMEVMGLSPVTAGNLIFLMNVGLILGSPAWGALSDRVFRTRKWLVFGALAILGGITFTISGLSPGAGLGLLAALFFCFGFFGAPGALIYAHIKDLMPLEMAGTSMTGLNFFTMIGPAVFLQGLGSLMQHLYPDASRSQDAFSAALMLCTGCLTCVSALYLLTREAGGKVRRRS
jgi:sugar phosphate permease